MISTGDPLQGHPVLLKLLEPGEEIEHAATAGEAVLAVTTKRIAVVDQQRAALDIAIDGLRRIQFDIEKTRPATLVLVPESPHDNPQVLAVRPEEYEAVAAALVTVGHRLAERGPDTASVG
jgi:hypothetical protein